MQEMNREKEAEAEAKIKQLTDQNAQLNLEITRLVNRIKEIGPVMATPPQSKSSVVEKT